MRKRRWSGSALFAPAAPQPGELFAGRFEQERQALTLLKPSNVLVGLYDGRRLEQVRLGSRR
jgi:hypothetical protein